MLYRIIILLIGILFLVSCKKEKIKDSAYTASVKMNENAVGKEAGEERYTIGWSVNDVSREFYKAMQDGVLEKGKEIGVDIITHDQMGSTAEMISGAINLINQGIDALIIAPVTPEAMIVVSGAAREAGIPIVVLDTGYDRADIDAFIVSDSFGGGVLAGEYALELIEDHNLASKNVAIITVEEKFIYARRRGEGFKNAMLDAGYNIAAQLPGNSNPIDGYYAMKEILNQYSDDLAVVFAENDRMALGAATAINEAGKKGEIMVIGFDGDPSAIQAIKDGLMQGTVAQQSFEMGELGVEVANSILNGEAIAFDDRINKELYVEVYLIDETGEPRQVEAPKETKELPFKEEAHQTKELPLKEETNQTKKTEYLN